MVMSRKLIYSSMWKPYAPRAGYLNSSIGNKLAAYLAQWLRVVQAVQLRADVLHQQSIFGLDVSGLDVSDDFHFSIEGLPI